MFTIRQAAKHPVRRRLATAATAAITLLVMVTLFRWRQAPATEQSAPAKGPAVTTSAAAPAARIFILPVAATTATLNSPDTYAEDDLAVIGLLLAQYRQQFGGNPVGANDEITAALSGNNPKGIGFLPASAPFIDSDGQLIDRWGRPYFFHALSAQKMEIQSGGPDRKLHTSDDIHSDF